MKLNKKYNLSTEFAYIAGFIDGEGCIRIKKSGQSGNSYYLMLHITNTNLRVLKRIKSILGGKIQYQERGKNKDVFQLHFSCNDACNVLKVLLGFLRVKKKEANLGIYFHENNKFLSKCRKNNLYKLMRALKK